MTAAEEYPPVFHLPGLILTEPDPELVSGWHEGSTAAGRRFRAPALTRAGAVRVAQRVRDAAVAARRERRLADVVRVVAQAAGSLSDASTSTGKAAVRLLEAELDWPISLAEETLGEMSRLWTEDALWCVLNAELPDPNVLDGFSEESAGRRRCASGPPLLLQIMAANVPGVAVTGVIRGLLCRSGLLVKAPEDAPGLPALFAAAVSDRDALLGESVAATWWPADRDGPLWEVWARCAGKVVVYGGEEAVAGVRARTGPDQGLVAYGPKIGVAVVLPDAEPVDAASALARDVCAYEQQGCVSPRLVLVVSADGRIGGRPAGGAEAEPGDGRMAEVGAAVASALAEETARIRRPSLRAEEATEIRSLRAEVEFRGYAGGGSRVLGNLDDLSCTVLVDDPPVLDLQPLPRLVRMARVASIEKMEDLLRPLAGRIQAIGHAGGGEPLARLASAAARLGVSRLSPLGRMAWPPADWRHDGRFQLLPLLEWTDWEVAAGSGCENPD